MYSSTFASSIPHIRSYRTFCEILMPTVINLLLEKIKRAVELHIKGTKFYKYIKFWRIPMIWI